MAKKELIFKFFHKAHLLTTNNKNYRLSLDELFRWLTANDRVESDQTAKLLRFSEEKRAEIICHENCILAGSEEITYLLSRFTHLSTEFATKDGQPIKTNQVIAEITGPIQEILGYERTMINILQRLSGIATQTKDLINIVSPYVKIAATRKTPWGLLDKKAVAVGGGLTHRLNLNDGILIKDNHLKIMPIPKAVETILPQIHRQLIEVETKTKTEVIQTLDAFNKFNRDNYLAIMFDNFSAADINNIIKHLYNKRIIFEASGGINQSNLAEYAQTGVDIISLGSLTHSARAVDLSLEII